jgi:hypothetical protein
MLLAALAACPAEAATLTSPVLGNIFTMGEPVTMTLHANGGSAHWALKDFYGKEAASGDAALSGGAATISIHTNALGYFTLDASSGADSAEAALAILPASRPASANSPFGVMTHFAKGWSTDIVPLIERAGLKRVRDEQPWRKVEKEPGRYDFPPEFAAYMGALKAHNIDPLIVLDFSNPHYDGDKTPYTGQGRAGFSAYARAVLQRYGAQISGLEVWNEYNGSFCDGPCRTDRPGFYAGMLKDTYAALKSARPDVTVAGGAAVNIPLDYFEALFKKSALDSMDTVVIHPYRKDPEGVEEKIAQLRDLMQRYGKVKPIWATEFGDQQDMRKNRNNEAPYLVKMSALLLSAKVERIYWYLLKDYQQFEGMGLLRGESDPLGRYAPSPAYAAYATLIRQLDGAHFVRREPSDPETRVYLFADGTREVRVAWADQPGEHFDLKTDRPAQVIDMMGNAKTIAVDNGGASVPLDLNPVYLISAAR